MYKYKELESRMNERVAKLTDCAGYEAFVEDLHRLYTANTMCGLCQIRAEVWLDKLSELCDKDLREYVEKYKAGVLNPFAGY